MVYKMTAAQELFEPRAPVKKRQSRRLLQDRFNSKSYMGDIGIDHPQLEGP